MSNIIIFDFEVFKYDTLLGCKILKENNETEIVQLWDLSKIKEFYENHKYDIRIGHNNKHYDNLILQSIVENKDPKEMNDRIILDDEKIKFTLPLINYDLMGDKLKYSLKVTEAFFGKDISETEVDFNLNRKLTNKEKELTEKYNRDDLEQTTFNFFQKKGDFDLRISMINQFKLSPYDISLTGTQIAAKILKMKKDFSLEYQVVKPYLYPSLKLENKELINYYLENKFRTTEKLLIDVCGLTHTIGSGGIHAARNKVHVKKALYLDVSGYYNLIMLNYNLLPRNMSKESKELYEFMYHEQLKLKGVKGKELERSSYKVVLLAVFGSMMNKYCDFYDIWNGYLVTITGQLFLVDLLEKLEKHQDILRLIQSNTDGIIVEMLDWSKENVVLDIVKDWMERTHFVIKPKYIYNIHQRDVNNYFYTDEKNNICTLGEAVGGYETWKTQPFIRQDFNSKQPFIINEIIVNYFIYNKLPEETVYENKNDIRAFQFICKKGTFNRLEFELEDLENGEIKREKVQNINRVFASNSKTTIGRLFKKNDVGKVLESKYPNLPENIFVYNKDISSKEVEDLLINKINYNYYINRGYERIKEFLNLFEIKDITVYD